MRLPTVVLKNKRGKRIVVNEAEYARDLGRGKWTGWQLVTSRQGELTEKKQKEADAEQLAHTDKEEIATPNWDIPKKAEPKKAAPKKPEPVKEPEAIVEAEAESLLDDVLDKIVDNKDK